MQLPPAGERSRSHPRLPSHLVASVAALALLAGCSASARRTAPAADSTMVSASAFRMAEKPVSSGVAARGSLAAFEGPEDPAYRLGPGDKLKIDVWGRPELSGSRVVGPDGTLTLPVVGTVPVVDLTVDDASAAVSRKVAHAYVGATATISVEQYAANRVLVLGRVSNPGVLQFDTPPRLLDAITRAGALPIGGIGADKAALTRCAIFRDRDKVVWIDLRSLLNGTDLGLNIRLKRDDVVYVPDAGDQLVYVLGYVDKPGAYTVTPDMSLLDALAQAGGPTPDAAEGRLQVVRPSAHVSTEVDLHDILAGNPEGNVALEKGDIVYVPANWLADVGYVFQKLSPATELAVFGAAVAP